MKEAINLINKSIDEKKDVLLARVESDFAKYIISSRLTNSSATQTKETKSTPPISYILYFLAILLFFGVLFSNSKIICLILAVVCIYGGYKFSNKSVKQSSNSTESHVDIFKVKNEITSKVLSSVKAITQEWETFMEQKQKDVYSLIDKSDVDVDKKDSLNSKIYVFEIVDISTSAFLDMIKSSTTTDDINLKIDKYKNLLKSAISNTAAKQISKYNSLCN